MPHELILLKNMSQPGYTGSLADYERAGGYQAIRKVLGKMPPGTPRPGRGGLSDRRQMVVHSQGSSRPALSVLQRGRE